MFDWTTLHGGDVLPPASWQPYPNAAVWVPIAGTDNGTAGSPSVHSRSAQMIAKLAGTSGVPRNPAQILPGQDSSSAGTFPGTTFPVYYALNSDPLVQFRKATAGFANALWSTSTGPTIRVPAAALPSNGTDKHFAVVQPDGTEWFFYKVFSDVGQLTPVAGSLVSPVYATGMARCSIYGDGLSEIGLGATAAEVAALWGEIRPEEMIAGVIGHALAMTANWSNNEEVVPAGGLARARIATLNGSHDFPMAGGTINFTNMVSSTSGLAAAWDATGTVRLPNGSLVAYTGMTGTAASGTLTGCTGGTGSAVTGTITDHDWPPNGARIQLAMTQAEIDAIADSSNSTGRWWNKAVLTALRKYGMFVMDTGGGNWSLKIQSGFSWYSLTGVDRWRSWAAGTSPAMTYDAVNDHYGWDIRTVVPWYDKLRVLDWADPLNFAQPSFGSASRRMLLGVG